MFGAAEGAQRRAIAMTFGPLRVSKLKRVALGPPMGIAFVGLLPSGKSGRKPQALRHNLHDRGLLDATFADMTGA